MDQIIEQGIAGIVVGIITTALLFAAKSFWNRKAVPFMKAIRYQGVKIEGLWTGHGENKDPAEGDVFSNDAKLFLEQNAHELSGLFIFEFKNEKKEFTLEFNVTGYIWEGYLTLNFTPKDRRITSYATALLKLHEGGTLLVGNWLFRNITDECVDATPLSLGRDLTKG